MKLYYQTAGAGRPLVILHGLFGSSDNWRAVAKQLAKQAQVIIVDLRNHGRSPHSSEQNYPLMADDLVELLDDLNLDKVDIIGHSVGGKVAMAFSQYYPQRLGKLVVVDIAPREYPDEHSAIFKALLALDLSQYSTRNEVDKALSSSIADKFVRQFLLMNLTVSEEQLNWQVNLKALFENSPQLLKAVCEDIVIETASYFIRGGHSDYIGNDDEAMIKAIFANSEIETIEQAGHWVHADAPQEFVRKVIAFLDYD